VSSGLTFDVDALFDSTKALELIPMLLIGMLLVRGTPALLYRNEFRARRVAGAAFLQSINLTIIVIAAQIGLQLDVIDVATSSALLAAGILSVLIYPPIALAFLGRERELEAVLGDEEL